MHVAFLGIVAATAIGWTSITVEPARSGAVNAPWQTALAGLDGPSNRTRDTLRRYSIDTRFRRDPEGALAKLALLAREAPSAELVFALAELSWVEARRLDRRRPDEALGRYLDTVGYAYDFLFDPALAPERLPSDPRFQQAFHLYNGSLDRILRAAREKGTIKPGETVKLTLKGGELGLRIALEQSSWTAEDVHEVLLASDYVVSGLPTSSYQFGLGVPLIGIRRAAHDAEGIRKGIERFYPPEMAFPLTAFLRPIPPRPADAGEEPPAPAGGRDYALVLVDPVQIRSAVAGASALAIEADITTPLAYMWSRTDLSKYRWRGLLRPGEAEGRAGLMLLRPYEPGKVPVVMVHGLASSPLAWIPMLNELLRDPKIQRNYQFLLYVYPTGVPVPIAAAGLRDALRDARAQFGQGPAATAFDQMVLIGHSMGGLLSHAMVVDSGDEFWRLSSFRPFGEIVGPPDVIEELKHYTFFEPLPFVQRVVFLATPHRGSSYARRAIGRLGSSLITEPDHYGELLAKIYKENPEAFDRRRFLRLPTSIETLETDSPVLNALLAMKVRPGVKLHSIIGANRAGSPIGSTDGVVTYASSHLDGVPETVVYSDHGVQKSPEAIRKVHSILLGHLSELAAQARPADVRQTAGP